MFVVVSSGGSFDISKFCTNNDKLSHILTLQHSQNRSKEIVRWFVLCYHTKSIIFGMLEEYMILGGR